MKSFLCRLLMHDYWSVEPTQEQRDALGLSPRGRPYLWIAGLRCRRCGHVLSEARAPGAYDAKPV